MNAHADQLQNNSLLNQAKERLINFFRQPLIKKSTNVLVPGILAAILFPIFGPLVSAPVAIISIQNGLKLLGISISNETVNKLLKLLEGKQIDESDLLEVLEEVLPTDKQANEEAAKALVTMVPIVKQAALTNPKLDITWLRDNLERNLKDQGEVMASIAHKVNELLRLDDVELRTSAQEMLVNWTRFVQSINVSGSGEVSDSSQIIKGRGANINQTISVREQGKVSGTTQNSELF